MIWQQIRDQVVNHFAHGVVCTRVEMSPSFFQKFLEEQRRLRSYHPTDKDTGKPVLGMVPKTMTVTIPTKPKETEITLVIKKTTTAPVGSFRLDSTPLAMNPISGRYE